VLTFDKGIVFGLESIVHLDSVAHVCWLWRGLRRRGLSNEQRRTHIHARLTWGTWEASGFAAGAALRLDMLLAIFSMAAVLDIFSRVGLMALDEKKSCLTRERRASRFKAR